MKKMHLKLLWKTLKNEIVCILYRFPIFLATFQYSVFPQLWFFVSHNTLRYKNMRKLSLNILFLFSDIRQVFELLEIALKVYWNQDDDFFLYRKIHEQVTRLEDLQLADDESTGLKWHSRCWKSPLDGAVDL